MSERILCVDDDPNILAGYQRTLRRRFVIDTASNGDEALEVVKKQGPYAVVVADMRMPGMDGVQLLARFREVSPDTVRVMLTGNADLHTAVEAVNRGHIFRFLNKPCSPEALSAALESGLNQYRLITAERELLEGTLSGSIKVLTEILSLVEPQFFGRAQVLRDYIRILAPVMKIEQTWELEVAAMVSQIGYVTVPAAIIQKERSALPLNPNEQEILSRVPEIGAKLLKNIPRLGNVAQIVLYQNKYYDGTGFPRENLAGPEIPLGARIIKALNDFIHLEIARNPRPEILAQLRKRAGRYDPKVLDAIYTAFVQNPQTPATGQAIKLKDLAAGHVLLSDILTSDGVLIVPAGTEISATLLEKLNNFATLSGIKEPIFVN